jgi:SnoaL-like domain
MGDRHDDRYFQDRAILRELIQNWAVWRDSAHWDEFRKVWHEDGRMLASWKQAPFEEFIAASHQGMERGIIILHMLGGSAIKVEGFRAISQTKIAITQRAPLDGVLCDVNSLARHFDFWEKRPEKSDTARWGLVLRETIFDKADFSPVEHGAQLAVDKSLLNQFPAEYAALAYLQEKAGYTVRRDMPHGWRGPEVEALYRRGEAWLAGRLAKPWDRA